MTSDEEIERATDGPDVLYLQPGNRGDERCWCEDDMPDANDTQPWNKYIREDLIPVSIQEAAALIRRLRDERDEARNKALNEARMAVSLALSMYSCTCHHAAEKAILALKEPKPIRRAMITELKVTDSENKTA